jgi:single-stranded DNA-binding protein
MFKMIAVGRLAHLPELRFGKQASFCEFRLLATRSARGEDITEAVTFVCFGDQAEQFCELGQKGQLIWAEGWQETQRWTDAESKARTTTRFNLHRWNIGGPLEPERAQRTETTRGPPVGDRKPPLAAPATTQRDATKDEAGHPSDLI